MLQLYVFGYLDCRCQRCLQQVKQDYSLVKSKLEALIRVRTVTVLLLNDMFIYLKKCSCWTSFIIVFLFFKCNVVSVAAGATDCGSWWVNSYGGIEFLSLSMHCKTRKAASKNGGLLYVNSYGRFCLANHVVLVWVLWVLMKIQSHQLPLIIMCSSCFSFIFCSSSCQTIYQWIVLSAH